LILPFFCSYFLISSIDPALLLQLLCFLVSKIDPVLLRKLLPHK
jgi:hypothetical protein